MIGYRTKKTTRRNYTSVVQLSELADAARDRGAYNEAAAGYRDVLSLNPNRVDIWVQYGNMLKDNGRFEDAETAYLEAISRDPTIADTYLQYGHLLKRSGRLEEAANSYRKAVMYDRSSQNSARPELQRLIEQGVTTAKITVAFDVSDLYQYFRHHRLPTGIQRVQMEAIPSALISTAPDLNVRIVCFNEADDFWREIPAVEFVKICELSLKSGDSTATDWRNALEATDTIMRQAPAFIFPQGAYLVNIGTSWWLQNYFLRVREAKRAYQIRYVPFVHDMIPIITPECCVAGLTQDFISWVLGVFDHADFYFVNSETTRNDLKKVAAVLGHKMLDEKIITVRLDADIRRHHDRPLDSARLAVHRLTPGNYVLFVGTIEPRKNHLLAFAAWRQLIKQHGLTNVPKLVCVGSRGWLNEAVFAQHSASEDLKSSVLILSGVPDDELGLLYENCLFTIFPSAYEGWGLPVTESLCYRKVPLTSNKSSLPEAGGEFAEYFDLGNENSFVAAVERLVFDSSYRTEKEALIRKCYRPRTWEEVSRDLIEPIASQWSEAEYISDNCQPEVKLGLYYPLRRNTALKIHRGMVSSEVFRDGDAWWGCDDWGCWIKRAPGRLSIRINEQVGHYHLYIGLRGLPGSRTAFDVTCLNNRRIIRGELAPGQERWICCDIDVPDNREVKIEIILEGYGSEMELPREDAEFRTISLGVLGFMICRKDDWPTRVDFIEAIALNNLDALVYDSACGGESRAS